MLDHVVSLINLLSEAPRKHLALVSFSSELQTWSTYRLQQVYVVSVTFTMGK